MHGSAELISSLALSKGPAATSRFSQLQLEPVEADTNAGTAAGLNSDLYQLNWYLRSSCTRTSSCSSSGIVSLCGQQMQQEEGADAPALLLDDDMDGRSTTSDAPEVPPPVRPASSSASGSRRCSLSDCDLQSLQGWRQQMQQEQLEAAGNELSAAHRAAAEAAMDWGSLPQLPMAEEAMVEAPGSKVQPTTPSAQHRMAERSARCSSSDSGSSGFFKLDITFSQQPAQAEEQEEEQVVEEEQQRAQAPRQQQGPVAC
jgi:hypothetical protein